MYFRKRAATLFATTAGTLALAAGTAFAVVAGTPVSSPNGNAGYDASNAAGFTDVQSVVTGGQYGLTVDKGAHGVQLCNKSSGFGAQVGLLSDNLKTTYHVASGVGTIPSPGCPIGGVLPSPVDFPNLSAVPYGHRVWTDVQLVQKTRTFKVLVCIIRFGLHHEQKPLAPDENTNVDFHPHSGFFGGFRCFFKTITITKDVVVLMAQDLDAPSAPVAGDLAGVQTRYVRVPRTTVFDEAGAGVNENLTKLVACSGNGFPESLAGPAAYVSAACQPISAFDHTTATPAGGSPTGLSALTTTEGISPDGTTANPALIAPNNTLATTPSTTPPGTATNASAGGDSFTMYSANAPVS